MRPGDFLSADDAVLFFKQCLREQGLDDVDVVHATEDFADAFYVRKQLGTQQLNYKFTFNSEHFDHDGPGGSKQIAKKQLARRAEEVARQFKERMVDRFEWDNRSIEVSMYDGGWAKCHLCDTKVHFDRRPATLFSDDAELSTPQPHPRDTERTVAELSGHNELLFKLYLIGQLREHCDRACPNYKYRMDKPPAMLDVCASD